MSIVDRDAGLKVWQGARQDTWRGVSVQSANVVSGKYRYTEDLLRLGSCHGAGSNPAWPVCPTPLWLSHWKQLAESHPDRSYAAYVSQGLHLGFRIGFSRREAPIRSSVRNHPSASENGQSVRDYITSEVSLGRLVGPVPRPQQERVHISPIGLVPKSTPGQWRMIVDLSFPRASSVNDGIDSAVASVSYASLDEAVQHILRLGKGTQLVKVDLKQAYRQIPVHPEDHYLLGLSWEGSVYVDRALPFGLRSAPKIFTAVADMIAWAFHTAGIQDQIHYLDDFLFFSLPASATNPLQSAMAMLEYLGVPVAREKVEGPACRVTFLGIVIDTVAFELRLPHTKIEKLQGLLEAWTGSKAHTRKELESLLGHLSHAASVVRPGRTFLRKLFALLHGAKAPHHFVRMSAGARADLAWWKCFLSSWNGSSLIPLPKISHDIFSDASGTYGCAAILDTSQYIQLEWPASARSLDISVKELIPVAIACGLWGPDWAGRHICFHSDNMAVVSVMSTQTAKSDGLMHLLRCISFYGALYSFRVSCVHVPGAINDAADALSRDNMIKFSALLPQAMAVPVPPPLVGLLVSVRPDWGAQAWTDLFIRSLSREWLHRH